MCLSQVFLPDLPSRLSPVEHMGWSVQDGGTRIQDQLRSLTSFLVEWKGSSLQNTAWICLP